MGMEIFIGTNSFTATFLKRIEMATKKEYAKWCMMLIEGEDFMVDDIFEAMHDDGFIDEGQEWVSEDEDDE